MTNQPDHEPPIQPGDPAAPAETKKPRDPATTLTTAFVVYIFINLALALPLTLVVPLVVFLDYAASASHGLKDRALVQWRQILPLVPFSALGVAAGLYLFQVIDTVSLTNALGVFIIFYAVYTLLVRNGTARASSAWAVPAGSMGGLVGTLFTAPIINQPQVGILSMDAVKKRPVVVESDAGDAIAIRPVGILAHSFDHRAIDGAYSAAYLQRLKAIIEDSDWNRAFYGQSHGFQVIR